jgi:sugar lactone lactonase YvrE
VSAPAGRAPGRSQAGPHPLGGSGDVLGDRGADISSLPGVAPSLLGESPLWHPSEQVLYWCDIPGHALNRFDPATGEHRLWPFDTDVACCAPLMEGGLLLALRSGLVSFDPATGETEPLIDELPYDPKAERFNDGKADAQGRLWVGTIHELREPKAALYRYAGGKLDKMADKITVSNGLAWSPDARTMYWSDTKAHSVYAFDFERAGGAITHRRVFAQFAVKTADQDLSVYGGRPDGAAMDSESHYWCAMFEGARLLRIAPDGTVAQAIDLPVRCPTMPCFGGADLKTLYITTSREKRPADELAREPMAGCVLQLRVEVPGLPANFARL